MNNFKCQNCGECCGPVPVTANELTAIKAAISQMPKEELTKLKEQKRGAFDCILLDKENKKCSIYDVRPEICRMFGFYVGLACPHNDVMLKPREAGYQNMFGGDYVGIMGFDIGWGDLLD